ncbi:hypothetical protein PVAND_014046 [Polypedilum vanderplanki]|uniref:Fucosyltransferase n=1 Tax=Polypedilum vanderplanki TaxID=319348 RepID=A0A9J6CTA0_POLVA|nr:hypothetical protein PVAND_014046 [Polypedilum vanderplanki]
MKIIRRTSLILLLMTSTFLFAFHLINNYVFEWSIARYKLIELKKELTSDREKFFVLFWTKFFDIPYWNMGNETNGPEYLDEINCPVNNCVFTHNKELIDPIYYYDAIVFHGAQSWGFMDLPAIRSTHQLYVFASQESPAETKHNLVLDDEFYNLTMSYRLDSEILWSYARIFDIQTGQFIAPSKNANWQQPERVEVTTTATDKSLNSVFMKKSKEAAWMVSHCNVFSKREDLVRKLQQYIDIDIYGKCGTLDCPREKTSECIEKYKIYLSFENALCSDYVTEKLFDMMNNYILPVVFNGVGNMSHFLPPKSYINANDFSSVETLGMFLQNLMKNETEYLSYFWWKRYYKIDTKYINVHSFCDLCKRLNENNVNQRVQYYKSISEWWTKGICVNSRIKF